ncbi:serine protease Do [Ruminiclostridium sufflavum DSM 19573]|uniref:Serine protease Do n=1 Tax=Ruminiclostridium sufflavum DSM 19573 TaxID=1121337 RepID=A0A318XN52_9FIRM|nr:trypsin-like peptidase domain-containing protein [Ruminiclostridium sufflavum]PYG88221.1 serine protease Do [Ruminiclostridium sufflavum DSM 19573]
MYNENDWNNQPQNDNNSDSQQQYNNDIYSQEQQNNEMNASTQASGNLDTQPQNTDLPDTEAQNMEDWSAQSQYPVFMSNQEQDTDNYEAQAQSNDAFSNQPQDSFDFDGSPDSQAQSQAYYKEIIIKPESKRKHKFLTYMSLVLVTSVVTSFVVGGALYTSFSNKLSDIQSGISATDKATVTQTASDSSSVSGTNLVTSDNSDDLTVTEIAKKVGPSIVGIKMTIQTTNRSFFFGSSSSPSTSDSEGSGIIISSDGYIMTNYHVVEYADPNSNVKNTTLTVYLPDKREATAKFVGGDSDNDLALIKIDLTDLPVAELGDSSDVEVGDLAVAIGNPLGMEFAGSVTSGVISALNRQLDTGNVSLNLIQTDAAINPGNSGGALLNSKGQVIGINSAKISITGVEGLGFAIPINTAKPIIEQLKTYGYVKGKPLVGISGQEVSEDISKMYGLPVGIYVVEVTGEGAAQAAGIVKGDVLTKLDGKEIKTMSDIDAVKKLHKAGDTVDAVVIRSGKTLTLKLTFTEDK